jgi:AcrR family transcriptional regulator
MTTPPKKIDRRVQKTHNLIRTASIEIMKKKGFTAMTVQDITNCANINRGTFYAHFSNKYELLNELVHERFQDLLAFKLPNATRWNKETLHLLIQIVLEHYKDVYRQCEPAEVVDLLIEGATKEELVKLLLEWLREMGNAETKWQVPIETIARVVSWTILGAAAHWSHERNNIPSEQIADDVLLVLIQGVGILVPNVLPE